MHTTCKEYSSPSGSFYTLLLMLVPLLLLSCTGGTTTEKQKSTAQQSENTIPVENSISTESAKPDDKGIVSSTGKPSNEQKEEANAGSEREEKATSGSNAGEKADHSGLILGITIGFMDLVFDNDGKTITISPEADRALTQIKKDGFHYIHMMEPFARGYMRDFPKLPVQAVKLLTDRGFKVLLTINGSPFINGGKDPENKWVYRYFPGDDVVGKDDDGGLPEHKKRLRKFMDALKTADLLPKMQFQLFDEPNSKKSFWGSFAQFETLLAANIEVLKDPVYGIADQDILGPAFTSKLMLSGNASEDNHKPYWDFAKNYGTNPQVNRFPFSFNWYPSSGNTGKSAEYSASDIKITKMYEGAWITGMNVTAYMTVKNLHGKPGFSGFRAQNTFKTKVQDIIDYAVKNKMAGIYFFNLKTRKDEPASTGRISTGLFNARGCPRYEYKQLLELLNRPVDFGTCKVPGEKEF